MFVVDADVVARERHGQVGVQWLLTTLNENQTDSRGRLTLRRPQCATHRLSGRA
jgi:hypothetical protein